MSRMTRPISEPYNPFKGLEFGLGLVFEGSRHPKIIHPLGTSRLKNRAICSKPLICKSDILRKRFCIAHRHPSSVVGQLALTPNFTPPSLTLAMQSLAKPAQR